MARTKYFHEYQKRPEVQKRRRDRLNEPEIKNRVRHQQRVRRKRQNEDYKYYMLTLLDLFDQLVEYEATYIKKY